MHIIHHPDSPAADTITFPDFLKVDIRAGTIVEASAFNKSRKPSYVLMINFGSVLGIRKSIAQITERYAVADLPGQRVMAVVNLPPRQIGPMQSQVLIVGFPDAAGAVLLAQVDKDIPDGARLA